MKNKYLKGAHLSERKVRELIKLFCDDLTATQIASITGISRITVNAYFKLIRTHIARFCEERNPLHVSNGTLAFIPMHTSSSAVESPESNSRKPLYGVYVKEGMVFSDRMPDLEASWLTDWLKGRIEAGSETVEKYRLHLYTGIADFNNIRLHRLNGLNGNIISGRNSDDDIETFWGMLKSRLVKFRGLNGGTLYLHVKETEFRFNYRSADIYDMLLSILHQQPLHTSKPMVVSESIPGK
ncbi:hypothetical protein HHL16_17655 [Pseudoflavitalea sp. G-6-1-2]|uniref:hypothetical protein n=1 Tax=Pseudoflavitalea sp. G-6-1-2 TaxID=2728841 RepID=UPI00146F0557|nr:hypothetical protein [Pseudoflavitalea sp. G-6-1-2]NML22714.1 hypothetical protein [Pseudoflavitalea sp. G-6-1-2]